MQNLEFFRVFSDFVGIYRNLREENLRDDSHNYSVCADFWSGCDCT